MNGVANETRTHLCRFASFNFLTITLQEVLPIQNGSLC